MLTPEQIKELDKPLDNNRLKHRQGGGGMQLNYLAGYDVIATANKLLGYGSWGYDLITVDLNPVTDEKGELVGSYYSARVRLIVEDCIPITEEGVCAVQSGRNPKALIDSHDMARKGAITDALKRAFRCYGDQFGNSLYDKDYDASSGVENHPTPIRPGNQQQAARPVTQPTPIKAQAPVKPLPPKASSGIVVIGPAESTCPKCDGPMELLKVVEEDGSNFLGERCTAKGCGYKRKAG